MDSRFVVPATIAAALHTFVLFGLTWPHEPPLGLRPTVEPMPDPAEPPYEWLEMNDPPSMDPQTLAPIDGSTDAPPQLPEPPAIDGPDSVPITPTPANNRPKSVIEAVRYTPPGYQDGMDRTCGCGVPIFSSDYLDYSPKARYQPAPLYPDSLRRLEIEGEVVVDFVVDEEGYVHDPQVVRSSDRRFDASTLRAVSKWRFEPGKRNGKIVRYRMQLPVAFKLNR